MTTGKTTSVATLESAPAVLPNGMDICLRPRAEDPNTWFPLRQLQLAVKAGRLGALTPRFHGAPTNRSQRVTNETDAPELLQRCRDDAVDVALLVPS